MIQRIVVFDIRGSIAHFRRPDTLSTHASYPIIPRTTLRGLVAAILGIQPTDESDGLPEGSKLGVRVLNPVVTVAQQLTMHGKKWIGKGGEDSFHRPTSIELVVKPHYRIFYQGEAWSELSQRLKNRQATYHTYLGSAYCLTFPEWVETTSGKIADIKNSRLDCESIVPTDAINQLFFDDGLHYSRVSGMLAEHIGRRRFRGTVNVLYEANGKQISFEPAKKKPNDVYWEFVRLENKEIVCLW